MVRRHGWQLPAHTFQVVAITVFFLLAIAFYVFFAPFLGNNALEYAAIAVYSPVALAVFLLYVRCSAIDPSDPGILANVTQKFLANQDKRGPFTEASLASTLARTGIGRSPGSTPARSSPALRSDKDYNNKVTYDEEERRWNVAGGLNEANESHSQISIGCLLCGWVVKDDNCRDDGIQQQSVPDEDVLFCTLCNAEVRKYSKHCRSCDKCVDGFDHHCRWLNNCVGKKNYITFVSLMATSLTLLVLDWGVGIAVLVRCFVDKTGIHKQIIEKLGNSFSRPPFAAVVALCTLVSLLASIPLGELFFFHILLIRKGITTYEYVVAMRAQNEQGAALEGEQHSLPSSPTSSTATGLSGSSSLGLQYKAAWCTPPRVFVEHQEDEVIPHLAPGRVPSTVDPDATTAGARLENRLQKRAVRISAWKLAKLNPGEASRAAAKARENSSVFRPVAARDMGVAETDYSSSSNISSRSSMSTDYGLMTNRKEVREEVGYSPRGSGYPLSRATSKDEGDAGTQSRSSYSSPGRTTINDFGALSPLPSEMRYGATNAARLTVANDRVRGVMASSAMTNSANLRQGLPIYRVTTLSQSSIEHPWIGATPASDGYEASSGESVDDTMLRNNALVGQPRPGQMSRNIRESKRAAVFWDRGAGRFMAAPNRTDLVNLPNPLQRQAWTEPSAINIAASDKPPSEGETGNRSPSDTLHNVQDGATGPGLLSSTKNLLYSGTSIFFGGPLSMPASGGNRKENSPVVSSNPPRPPAENKVILPKQASQENRPLRGSVLRSVSPVFVPRSMQANSISPQISPS